MKILLHAGLAGVLGLAVACSDSKDSDADQASGASKQIDSAGGTVTEKQASVEIPASALSASTKIGVTESDVNVEPPSGYTLAGPVMAFTPHGLTFTAPVTLTLPYSSSAEHLTVLRLEDENDKTWDVVSGGTFANGSATLEVTSFSLYAVAEESGAGGNGGASGSGGTGGGGGSSGGTGGASGGTGGSSESGGTGGASGSDSTGGASGAGGSGGSDGSLRYSCDATTENLRICSEYYFPKTVVDLLGEQLVPNCASPGILAEACDTTGAVAGCFVPDADGIPGVTVTNWFYSGTKEDIMNGVLCDQEGAEVIDPP